MSKYKKTPEQRFWEKVDKSGDCWEWQAAITRTGYGNFYAGDGRYVPAHRFSWKIQHGDYPSTFVLHRCDNRKCVNPDHLFLGTAKDNTHDMIRKGRAPRGVRHGMSKLTEKDVVEIRKRLNRGEQQIALSREYGMSFSVISAIARRRLWRHVD